MNENRCVSCGTIIPEGRMVCPMCEAEPQNDSPIIEMTIKIDTINKVKDFCNLCSKCAGEVDVYSAKYIVSGKSIMGLFSLDLLKDLKVRFYGNVPNEVKEGIKQYATD